jgi:hypothetical protein
VFFRGIFYGIHIDVRVCDKTPCRLKTFDPQYL